MKTGMVKTVEWKARSYTMSSALYITSFSVPYISTEFIVCTLRDHFIIADAGSQMIKAGGY